MGWELVDDSPIKFLEPGGAVFFEWGYSFFHNKGFSD